MPSYVHRVTKYDPADRNAYGHYTGPLDSVSDHGPIEAAYLEAVEAFARESGVDRLAVRDPEIAGFVHFGLTSPEEGHGLAGLFPPDLTGYHDGAEVPLPVALELVRIMLREDGAWCLLEAEDGFFVHVGYDLYVYVGTNRPCEDAVARTATLGLFPERLDASPYDPAAREQPLSPPRPADAGFRAWLDVWPDLRATDDAADTVAVLDAVDWGADPWLVRARWNRD